MRRKDNPVLYRTWYDMVRRCYSKKSPNYKYYGAKGITVCDEWRNDVAAFCRDMGDRPSPKHSIGRIDNSKGYSKDNCEWQTKSQQMRNTCRNTHVTVFKNGKQLKTFSNIIEAATEYGIYYDSIFHIMNGTSGKTRKSAGGYTFKFNKAPLVN